MNGIFNYQIPGRISSYNANQYPQSTSYNNVSHFNHGGFNLNQGLQGVFSQFESLISSWMQSIEHGWGNGGGSNPWNPGGGNVTTLAANGEEDGGSVGWKGGGISSALASEEDNNLVNWKPDDGGKVSTRALGEEDGGSGWKQPQVVIDPKGFAGPEQGGYSTAAAGEEGGGLDWEQPRVVVDPPAPEFLNGGLGWEQPIRVPYPDILSPEQGGGLYYPSGNPPLPSEPPQPFSYAGNGVPKFFPPD